MPGSEMFNMPDKMPDVVDEEHIGDNMEGLDDNPEFTRRSKVLLELAGATPDNFERLLDKHKNDIDEALLEILHRRILAAEEFDEGTDVVQGLTMLFKRLRREVERGASTPALRLLDDMLCIMDEYKDENKAIGLMFATERMEEAFSVDRLSGKDIFSVAEALGGGSAQQRQQLQQDMDEAGEYVDVNEFIAEVKAVMKEVEEKVPMDQQELQMQQAKFKEGVKLGVYSKEEIAEYKKAFEVEEAKVHQTGASLEWCTEFLKLAQKNRDSRTAHLV